jgi:capsular polysaccharide biosynthesis protein
VPLTTAPRRRSSTGPMAIVRRLWILPVSMIVVAAIAYLVSGLQSSVYTAQSTVVVTSAPGAVSAGNASQAAGLANTYSAGIPHDPVLQSYVSRQAGVSASNAINALPARGTLVRLTFTAPDRTAAIRGARALGTALSGSSPSSSVVTGGTLKVVQAPTTATPAVNPATGLSSYQAQVVLIVPPSGGPTEGINPDDADKLASTYAGIIPTDDTLLSEVGRATGLSSSSVSQNLSVVNEQSTSLLQVSFKSSQPSQAATGARLVAQLLAGAHPVAAGIVPSSVDIVSLPQNPSTANKSSSKAIAVGAALGLLLGIVLLIAWERSDPRIRDARELSAQVGCPATPVERLSPNAAYALLERWASLTQHVPARVAVLPAGPGVVDEAAQAISVLRDGGGELVGYVDARAGVLPEEHEHGGADSETGVVIVHAAPAGGDSAGEAVALGCDLSVVAVPAGARAADVRQLAEELTNFGIVPVWALLTPSGGRGARRQRRLPDVVSA